jgi:hypothetical protein
VTTRREGNHHEDRRHCQSSWSFRPVRASGIGHRLRRQQAPAKPVRSALSRCASGRHVCADLRWTESLCLPSRSTARWAFGLCESGSVRPDRALRAIGSMQLDNLQLHAPARGNWSLYLHRRRVLQEHALGGRLRMSRIRKRNQPCGLDRCLRRRWRLQSTGRGLERLAAPSSHALGRAWSARTPGSRTRR